MGEWVCREVGMSAHVCVSGWGGGKGAHVVHQREGEGITTQTRRTVHN